MNHLMRDACDFSNTLRGKFSCKDAKKTDACLFGSGGTTTFDSNWKISTLDIRMQMTQKSIHIDALFFRLMNV